MGIRLQSFLTKSLEFSWSFGSTSTCQFGCFLLWRPMVKRKGKGHCSRQITYSKRRECIVRKATELSRTFDADVGVLLFSPSGRLTSYGHKGRVEDIFLRYIEQPNQFRGPVEDEQFLQQRLKQLKYEAEMIERMERLEILERQLCEVNRQKYEVQDKIRSYNPDMTKILSVSDAHRHQQVLIDAIERIEKLKKAKLLEKEKSPSDPSKAESSDAEIPVVEVESDLTTEESVNSKKKRIQSANNPEGETQLPGGPHLSISYLETQKHWNLLTAEDMISTEENVLEV